MRSSTKRKLAGGCTLLLGAAVALGCWIMAAAGTSAADGLDAIIVLGARVHPDGTPSKTLEQRLDVAARYLEENPGCRCIVSGRGPTGDELRSEASVMREGLLARGVSPERVVMEDRSSSTEENLAFSSALLSPGERVGVVTSDYHMRRALLYAERAGIQGAVGVPCPSDPALLPANLAREAFGLGVLAAGR